MFRRILMATITNSKGKTVIGDKTNATTSTMGKKKAQIRAFNSKSSPIYKTQSDTSLVSGMRNLSLREQNDSTSRPPPPRRGFYSGKTTIRNLSDVAEVIRNQQVKNVVIVAGAGISTPSGIPDFRTPGTGLYDNLQQYKIPYPEAIFDIDFFHHNPRPFFTLAKELYPSRKYRPNYIHYFARLLHDKGMLLRMYTQNIDGLERLAGIPPTKLVEAHGTFATATCIICSQKYKGDDIKDKIFDDKIPRCKRSGCPGMIKPDIVFFGEELSKRFYYYLKDMLQTDMVLVMGTSLEVQPFAGIIDNVRWNIPRILFNRNAVGPFRHNKRSKDIVAEGDLLEVMQKFAGMMNWKTEMADLITESEGEFRIGNPVTAPVKTSPSPASKPDQPYASIWRQKARLDLFRANFYFSSSDSVSSTTESDSSDDDKPQKKSGLGNGQRNNTRFRGIKTDPPTRKFGTTLSKGNAQVTDRKPTQGAWMKPSVKNNSGVTTRSQTKLKPTESRKRDIPDRRSSLSLRSVPDSNRPSTRGSRQRDQTPTPSSESSSINDGKVGEKNKRITPNATNLVSQRTSSREALRKPSNGVSTRQVYNRPPIQPSSKPRAAQQRRNIDRQKTLFRAGSAEIPRLTYRHQIQKSVRDARILSYANQSLDSSSDTSSDDSDDSR
ncbi:NAD-dependent deacetylase sir2A-like isoform X2 [Haliotis rufescens]|uniref:NAD-dependent deacetylase sir2A-like isoform X2 n=1 Tax=Haliotis rufescens TaxID=6454 RepID=UPI00201EED8A|nr:NAD-dependent deacetylase sir2A-like isoform X2 [Haliotis rufescens]